MTIKKITAYEVGGVVYKNAKEAAKAEAALKKQKAWEDNALAVKRALDKFKPEEQEKVLKVYQELIVERKAEQDCREYNAAFVKDTKEQMEREKKLLAPKFKAGDKVRWFNKVSGNFATGTIITCEPTNLTSLIKVECDDGRKGFFSEDGLEKIEDKPKFKVGDMVEFKDSLDPAVWNNYNPCGLFGVIVKIDGKDQYKVKMGDDTQIVATTDDFYFSESNHKFNAGTCRGDIKCIGEYVPKCDGPKPKFKAGDTVEVISTPVGGEKFIGRKGVVEKEQILKDRIYICLENDGERLALHPDHLAVYKSKLKVGDKVEALFNDDEYGIKKGDIGTVRWPVRDFPNEFGVIFDSCPDCAIVDENELRLVNETESNPKFKKGDSKPVMCKCGRTVMECGFENPKCLQDEKKFKAGDKVCYEGRPAKVNGYSLDGQTCSLTFTDNKDPKGTYGVNETDLVKAEDAKPTKFKAGDRVKIKSIPNGCSYPKKLIGNTGRVAYISPVVYNQISMDICCGGKWSWNFKDEHLELVKNNKPKFYGGDKVRLTKNVKFKKHSFKKGTIGTVLAYYGDSNIWVVMNDKEFTATADHIELVK